MRKDELVKTIEKISKELAFDRNKSEKIAEYCQKKFDLPPSHFMDLIFGRVSLYDEKAEVLYFLSEGIDEIRRTNDCLKYFEEAEKAALCQMKYVITTFEYPFCIPCLEVIPGKQWIGVITAAELMKLRKADMIRYNIEKQRARRKSTKGGESIFAISVHEKSVNQIAKLMQSNEYISDDLTFDIPDDASVKWEYNQDKKELEFTFIEKLDITDGYHRYLAVCKNYDQNPSFDYPLEIRLTKFSISKTQRFIYQKAQTNRMSVSQANSFNVDRASNEVINRINERGSGLALAGQISRTGGNVDYSALSDIIEYYWFKGKVGEPTNKEIAEVGNEVKAILNGLVNNNPDYYDKYLDFRKLVTYFYLVKTKGESYDKAIEMVDSADKKGELKKIVLRALRKSLFDQIETIEF